MDKYDAVNDHYCYAGTSTLKNKLNIKNMGDLERAERELERAKRDLKRAEREAKRAREQ